MTHRQETVLCFLAAAVLVAWFVVEVWWRVRG